MLNFSIMQKMCRPQIPLKDLAIWHLTLLHGFACLFESILCPKGITVALAVVAHIISCSQCRLSVCHRVSSTQVLYAMPAVLECYDYGHHHRLLIMV